MSDEGGTDDGAPDPGSAPIADLEVIDDATRALEACGDLFRADPIGCAAVTITLYPGRSSELLRLHDGADTVGAAVSEATGSSAASYTLTPLAPGAAVALAAVLPDDRRIRLVGRPDDVAAVAGAWADRTDGAIDTGQLFRWYRLGDLNDSRKRKGQLHVAERTSADRAAEWMVAFGAEIGQPMAPSVAATRVDDAINEGRLLEWRVGDDVVSQLTVSPARFGVVRINGVYTPPPLRKHGYSSAITAAVAAQQIARQKVDDVVLDQPASNAATNRMFRRLGFDAVGTALVVNLVP